MEKTYVLDLPTLDVAQAERALVQLALQECQGNVVATARALGVTRATLYRWIERWGLRDCQREEAALRQARAYARPRRLVG